MNKKVSIIIPNLHSPVIGRVLEALKQQTGGLDDAEIIVVGMDKFNLIESDQTVRFIETPEPVSAAVARNLGMENAQGDIFAFLDSDCIPDVNWLRELLSYYADPNVYALAGGVDFPEDEYWTLCDNISTFYAFHKTASRGTCPYAPTLNFSLRREVVEQVGPLDEGFSGAAGEDTDWTLRIRFAGYTIHFEPTVLIQHCPVRNSLLKLLRRAFFFGRRMMLVVWRYREHQPLRFYERSALLMTVLSPILAAGVTLKVFFTNPRLLAYWYAIPPIFMAKVIARLGGAYHIWCCERPSAAN